VVAAAGTHLVSEKYHLAAIGNVFTQPEYRGRGYATACTAAVVSELMSGGFQVALNVGAANAPAIHIYEHLALLNIAAFSRRRLHVAAPGAQPNGSDQEPDYRTTKQRSLE